MKMVRWGVLGQGRAGRARAEAIRATEGALLVGHWSRRDERSPSEAIRAAAPEVLVVATEDGAHAEGVAWGLAAGADVLVEYPLVTEPGDAGRLADIAREAGRGIRVSWLGWHAALGRAIRREAETVRVMRWEVGFEGGCPAWVGEGLARGRYATQAAGRLRMLWDLMGGWRAARARVFRDGEACRCRFELEGSDESTAILVEHRHPGATRRQVWHADGRLLVPLASAGDTAFRTDQAAWQGIRSDGAWGIGLSDQEMAFVTACAALDSAASEGEVP
jgi:hypothetical protein